MPIPGRSTPTSPASPPSPRRRSARPARIICTASCPQRPGSAPDAGPRWRRTPCAACTRGASAPLLVGGTGLYFQTLLRGIADIPPVAPEISARWTQRLAEEGPERLHAELGRLDPAYAARIHPHDRQRIVRALEVQDATGKPFSWWHEHAMSAPLCAGPPVLSGPHAGLAGAAPRPPHRPDAGRGRAGRGPAPPAAATTTPAAPGWSGIGCAEVLAHLRGELSLADCRALWLRHTRAYAKRQLTWFRGPPGGHPRAPRGDGGTAAPACGRPWPERPAVQLRTLSLLLP